MPHQEEEVAAEEPNLPSPGPDITVGNLLVMYFTSFSTVL